MSSIALSSAFQRVDPSKAAAPAKPKAQEPPAQITQNQQKSSVEQKAL